MLVEFRVANFRSIGGEQVLSLVPATNQKEYPDNIFSDGKNQALNVVAIYGANGSGKSNLLRALNTFRYMLSTSAKSSSTEKLLYDPFLLREGWEKKPTSFEVTFSLKESRYRYGFTYNQDEILKEWLFRKGVGREVVVFQRKEDLIDPSTSLKGNAKVIEAAIDATRTNSLFLATLDMLNVEEANVIFESIGRTLHVDGVDTAQFGYMKTTWGSDSIKALVEKHLEKLKLGLTGIQAEEQESSDKEYKIFSKHNFYDKDGKVTDKSMTWDYLDRESSGSIKALEMSVPIVVALGVGSTLVIDEIEAKMHPLLTLNTINLFLNKKTNPKNAQLIFSTHDTNLLSYADLRRDQIYFAEKNTWESTEIYSLSDFVYVDEKSGLESKERPDTDKEKRYIEGRYGAIPVLGPMAKLKAKKNG